MRKFFKTVAIVTIFSISEKFLGFLYRIFLSRTIGTEGLGLFQVALSVFGLIFTLSCSGTPITVSRIMTKYRAQGQSENVQKIITAGLCFTLMTVVPVCLIFIAFGKHFNFLFADPRCMQIFMILLPGLIFTSIYSVLRGVFWGDKDFLPYSIIELLEEICMIIVGIILISKVTDVYEGAKRAGIAVLISYLFSFTLASIVFFIRKHKFKNPKSQFKPLLTSALPITAMRTASSFTTSLISIILPLRLIASGMTQSGAMSAYGYAMGQALPLLFIPTTLIGSFTLVLVPEISENFYKNKHFYLKRDLEKSIKFTTFLTCFFIPIFLVCGQEIGIIIFSSQECGFYLSASAFLIILISLSSITTSSLNSMGLENKTLIYYLIGGIAMLACIWFLPSVLGIYSLLIGFFSIYGTTSILNLTLINKTCKEKPKYLKFLTECLLLTLPTALFGLLLEKLLINLLGSFFTLLACSVLMVIFNILLCIGFNLISGEYIVNKVKTTLSSKKKQKKQVAN